VTPLITNRKLPFLKLTPKFGYQKKILDDLLQIYDTRTEKSSPIQSIGLFYDILGQLYENHECESNDLMEHEDIRIFKDMLSYIHENHTENLSLEDIASSGNVSISKCCRLFHTFSCNTPNVYMTKYRLKCSEDYLLHTDKSMTEISQLVGFNSSSYYAEMFRKYYHMTPLSFRKSGRK
jgi:AraC-like DNA-binding protein